jgi:hypothetical protein
MDAWQQITQQTIQNCFRKAGSKYQPNVNKMATDYDDDYDYDDGFGQDWEELCAAQKFDFQNYVSVNRDVETSGVQLSKNYAKYMGVKGVWRKRIKETKIKKIWCQASSRLTKL